MKNIQIKTKINPINSKLNEMQSPRELKVFNKIIREENHNFILFKSVYDLILLVFIGKNYSIITYNVIDNKKIFEIKKANETLNELKHYFDKNNERDLVSSISLHDNNIKIWNFNNLECILNINYRIGNFFLNLNSVCFLNNGKDIHLIVSSINMPQNQLIHIYNLRGEKIKEINNNKLRNYFVGTFYDDKFLKNYIIISTNADVRALDYNDNKIIKHYTPVNEQPIKVTKIKDVETNRRLHFDENHTIRLVDYSKGPLYIIVKECGNITKLFAGMKENTIKIWNFHSTQLLSEICISKLTIKSICLWDEENLLVGTSGGLKLIDLNKNKLAKKYTDIINIERMDICTIPKYGKCLITENYNEMNLWTNKNSIKK